jgi:hypothetical protein
VLNSPGYGMHNAVILSALVTRHAMPVFK